MPTCSATMTLAALAVNLPNSYSFGHISDRQIAEKLANPADRFDDGLAAVGIGKEPIGFAKLLEGRAGHRRDTRLVEELALKGAGIQTRAAHIRKRVERAARLRAAKPG